MTLKRILVPVDFSDASSEALEYAIKLGQPFGATLIVLFVVEPLYYAGDLGGLLEEEQRFGRGELSRLKERLQQRGVKFRIALKTGTPYQVIGAAAQEWKADVIVMATHGRRGVSHLVMGSVAEKVVRTAPCPVLTVRPRHKKRRAV